MAKAPVQQQKKPGRQKGQTVVVDPKKARLKESITNDILNAIRTKVKETWNLTTLEDEKSVPYDKNKKRHPIVEGIAINLGYITPRLKPTKEGAIFVNRLEDFKKTAPTPKLNPVEAQEKLMKLRLRMQELEKQLAQQ